jgi:hypothetical protein
VNWGLDSQNPAPDCTMSAALDSVPRGDGHAANPLPADIAREHRPEPVPPVTHRLVADVDAALEQEVFHIPQTERKPHVHHHYQAYHLGR